jgi:hypothetical protein
LSYDFSTKKQIEKLEKLQQKAVKVENALDIVKKYLYLKSLGRNIFKHYLNDFDP